MAVPYWMLNLSQARIEALEARWASPLTQAQLANPWQQVLLDGEALPGVWHFKKMKRKVTAQANKKAGSDGGSATLRGLTNPEFQLEGELFLPSQFDAWIKVAQKLDVVGNPQNRAQHTLEHPMASLSGVRYVLVLELEYSAPDKGGPLGVTLGLLGVNQRDGATKRPKAPPTPAPTTVPTVDLKSGEGPRENLSQFIKPPGPAR